MEREVLYGTEQEKKGITNFYQLKTLAPNTEIAGTPKGRFESKKTPGYFFHVIETETGEVNAYGTCRVLDERVAEFTKAVEELGLNPAECMMSTTYLGRKPTKKDPKMTAYAFTKTVVFKPKKKVEAAAELSPEAIPF